MYNSCPYRARISTLYSPPTQAEYDPSIYSSYNL